ncbi:MAG: YajQ family cyclic di-GMP-binding protein [Candidatus Krumholzibacteriia bacterium]
MPSFDVVSDVDMHEVTNALDQANREVGTRFDFKGSNARFVREDAVVTMHAPSDFQLKQMLDILQGKLAKRQINLGCMKVDEPQVFGKEARQIVTLRRGIDGSLAKQIVKVIKDKKMKVQASIQGDKVRVTGKKRDDLQTVIGLLEERDWDMPLQFDNFRD